MECDLGSSTGSTVSGSLNTVFKTKNPVGYIYISHPFGILRSPQKKYSNNNIKILEFRSPIISEENKMNVKCGEYYRTKNRPYLNHPIQYRNPIQEQINKNARNKIIFEDYLSPEFKCIINSIRKAWNSSNLPSNYEKFKDKNESQQCFRNYSQEDGTILTDLLLQRPKQLIRRYSVPETAIRKYNFIYDKSCTKNSNTTQSINPNKDFSHTNNNYQQYTKKLNYPNKLGNTFTGVCNIGMLGNYKIPVEKPLTMPEINRKKDCFYCSSKKSNSIENSKESTNTSDIFISDLLINNLNEDMAIAQILINNINNDDMEKNLINLNEKPQISSLYISPDRLIGIVNSDKRIKTYQSYTDINIKSSELLQAHPFVMEKNNKILPNSIENVSDMGSKNNNNKISASDQLPIVLKRPESTIISSSFNLTNRTDNDRLSTSEMQLLPIGTNQIYDNKINSFNRQIKLPNIKKDNILLNKREKMELANIETNLKHKIIENDVKKNGHFKIPKIEELMKTPLKNQSPGINKSTISKSILNSIEAYTFDSVGNINFRVLSAAISKRDSSPNQSVFTAKYNQKTHSSENNVRKITIFEAQSNMVTPDNDNGPRRFYQKTEILNGDKKIDILEIVECMQSSINCNPKSVLHTKVSKIPIPIDNFKFMKKEKNNYVNSILQPKILKLENNGKQNDVKEYEENIHIKYDKNNVPKFLYPLENVGKNPPKVNSKIQAVKPLRPFTNNIKKEVTASKNYNCADQRDKYSTGAYLSTTTDASLQNTVTPSSGTAIHGSTSLKNFSKNFSNKTDTPSFRAMTRTKFHPTPLNAQNNLENTKFETPQVCQYDLANSNDYIRHNKLNAWRIPSSNLDDKNYMGMPMESRILPKTILNKRICNNNCQLCSCCSIYTPNSRIVYSPTLSVCSLCSKLYNSTRLPTCNSDCPLPENKISIDPLNSCKDKNIFHCNKNCKIFPPISNSVCECMTENSNISYLCNPETTSRLCQYSKCSKVDDLIFPEGILSNSRLDFSAEGLVTPSTTTTESHWKSHNELFSCNWKSNNDQAKASNLATGKMPSTQNNTISKPVWTVTVTTKCLQQAPDLKMEFKFPQPPAELSIENNFSENEENEHFSLDSVNSAQKTTNPTTSGETYSKETNQNKASNVEDCYDNDFGGFSLNFTNLLTKRNFGNSKQDSKNLSIMGNAIAPEQKPRVQTMSERDLTRRRYHKSCNNFSMRNNL